MKEDEGNEGWMEGRKRRKHGRKEMKERCEGSEGREEMKEGSMEGRKGRNEVKEGGEGSEERRCRR